MKVAVICSNGKVGKLVVKKALSAGFEVTGFARGENKSEAKKYVQKDIFDITKQDLTGFDVVVDAFGAWTEPELPNHGKSLAHLCGLLSGTKTRLLIVGGAGSLYTDKEHTARVMEGANFPDMMFSGHISALQLIFKRTHLKPESDCGQEKNLR